MKVLITGGAGYIGSHASRVLRTAGHEVVILDNLSTGFERLTRGFRLVEADISDRDAVLDAVAGCSAVVHFAASASVATSQINPREYYCNNLVKALALLDAVMDAGVRTLVFSSSCAVYGIPEKCPITENMPTVPANTYGATKLAFEKVLQSYAHAYGLKFMALRYFNAAGADEGGEIGELHNPELHLIPNALRAAAGLQRLTLYGNDYPTPDGTCIRDYVHVSDIAEAHARALDYLTQGGESQSLNLGTGRGTSNLQIAWEIERVTGLKVPVDISHRRPGDPAQLYADPSKAETVLGWRAKRNLEQIVKSAWDWMRKQQLTSSSGAGG